MADAWCFLVCRASAAAEVPAKAHCEHEICGWVWLSKCGSMWESHCDSGAAKSHASQTHIPLLKSRVAVGTPRDGAGAAAAAAVAALHQEFMCLASRAGTAVAYPQCGHLCGVGCSCVSRCLFNVAAPEAEYPQCGQ